MKKLIALLLALCLLVPFAAFGENAAATEDAAQETGAEVTLHDVRYYFEHKLLPQLMFENPDQFLGFILENGIRQLWLNFITNLDFSDPYTDDQFCQSIVHQTEDDVMVRVDLPEPESNLLCCRVYCYWNLKTDVKAYFTVEYDLPLSAWFLCEWTREGVHKDYGVVDTVRPADAADCAESLEREAAAVLYIIENGVEPGGFFDPAAASDPE